MSYDDLDASISNARPIQLYEFARGAQRWRYTNAGLDVVQDNQTFHSIQIKDDGIRQTGEASADALNIDVPLDLELLGIYRIYPPSTPIELTIWDKDLGDPAALVKWVGLLSDVILKRRAGKAKLVCRPLSSEQDNTGLRLVWGRQCPYALYDTNCRVDKEQFRTTANLTSASGITITAGPFGAHPDGWFTGGFIEWEVVSGAVEQRGIDSHVGTNLTLLGGSLELKPGVQVRAYPGCARTVAVCGSKFDNVENYGGVPALPGRSPFDGNPVF
ncbi:MAG: phage BR0599 family protein [Alcanivorax sp.]